MIHAESNLNVGPALRGGIARARRAAARGERERQASY